METSLWSCVALAGGVYLARQTAEANAVHPRREDCTNTCVWCGVSRCGVVFGWQSRWHLAAGDTVRRKSAFGWRLGRMIERELSKGFLECIASAAASHNGRWEESQAHDFGLSVQP